MTRILLFALGLAMMAGCAKDIDTFNPDPLPPVIPEFEASAFIEVVDVTGAALEGVAVQLGTLTEMTDENGIVHLKDVDMAGSTYVTASLSGFFHGSRRFYPTEGNTHFVRIMLMRDGTAGSFQASSGGQVAISGGVTMNFPPNSIVNEDGTPYSGSVNVAAQPIAADDPELSDKMPGDLVGRTTEGNTGALASMGMVAVELRSSSGDLLNVAEGQSVEMRMEVPADLLSNASSTIPMWYFDETAGFWVEEGEATLQGSEYVANVEHFTYWNYDAWFPIVKWGATFQYADGTPASQVSVCLTLLEIGASKCSYTNDDGLVCGMVASDELILMEVKDQCGNVIYSEQIGPYSDTTMIGPIIIDQTAVTLTNVSGCVVNCDEDPVTNGFVQISAGGYNSYVALDDEGCFEKTLINCNESDIVVTAIDESELKQSLPQTFSYAEDIDAGTLQACEDLQEYITVTVETWPDDTYTWFTPYAYASPQGTTIAAIDSTTNGQFFSLWLMGDTTGTYTDVAHEIGMELPNSIYGYATDVTVTITYFGEVGDYIQGTLTGTINEEGGSNTHPMTGAFSVIRD